MALIQFNNVNLEYPVRETQTVTLKDLVLGRWFRNADPRLRTVKALNDLTFEVHEGERLGIIGLNGAGKSTLLKTIAGIYPIKSGQRTVQGSIGSLFDISLGFEQDATGWQNIAYRGYLQGETPSSIEEIRAGIADFTELGHFLDLPIRCYSTGMVMRLAFAIATARSPDIILIDEILGTGDIRFVKKANQRINNFIGKARIAILVSHHLPFLERYCTSIIWLHQGSLRDRGPAAEIIAAFEEEAKSVPLAA